MSADKFETELSDFLAMTHSNRMDHYFDAADNKESANWARQHTLRDPVILGLVEALGESNSFNEYMFEHFTSLVPNWKTTKYAAEHFKQKDMADKALKDFEALVGGKE